MRFKYGIIFVAGTLMILIYSSPSVENEKIPQKYQSLYRFIQHQLNTVKPIFRSEASTHPSSNIPVFSLDLQPANGNRGEALLKPSTRESTRLFLTRVQDLGITGVKVSISFPMLTESFPRSSEYREFYRWLCEEIKSRGLKILVSTGLIFSGSPYTNLDNPYQDYDLKTYQKRLVEHNRAVLKVCEPHYLTVANEPGTIRQFVGIPLDARTYERIVRDVIERLGHSRTHIGAGVGNWDPPEYGERLLRNTPAEYLDIHVYPVTRKIAENMRKLFGVAREERKMILIGEGWLYKVGPFEHRRRSPFEIYRRDVFEFWQPLDIQFIELLGLIGRIDPVRWVSPYWSEYFFAYLPHSPSYERMPASRLWRLLVREAGKNILSGQWTETGRAYARVINAFYSNP